MNYITKYLSHSMVRLKKSEFTLDNAMQRMERFLLSELFLFLLIAIEYAPYVFIHSGILRFSGTIGCSQKQCNLRGCHWWWNVIALLHYSMHPSIHPYIHTSYIECHLLLRSINHAQWQSQTAYQEQFGFSVLLNYMLTGRSGIEPGTLRSWDNHSTFWATANPIDRLLI